MRTASVKIFKIYIFDPSSTELTKIKTTFQSMCYINTNQIQLKCVALSFYRNTLYILNKFTRVVKETSIVVFYSNICVEFILFRLTCYNIKIISLSIIVSFLSLTQLFTQCKRFSYVFVLTRAVPLIVVFQNNNTYVVYVY